MANCAPDQVNFRGSDQHLPTARPLTNQITEKTESSFLQDADMDRSTGSQQKDK